MTRIFPHFNENTECPVCKTSEDKPTVLLAIDGTSDGNVEEAKQVHVDCAIADRCFIADGEMVLYKRLIVQ